MRWASPPTTSVGIDVEQDELIDRQTVRAPSETLDQLRV